MGFVFVFLVFFWFSLCFLAAYLASDGVGGSFFRENLSSCEKQSVLIALMALVASWTLSK